MRLRERVIRSEIIVSVFHFDLLDSGIKKHAASVPDCFKGLIN